MQKIYVRLSAEDNASEGWWGAKRFENARFFAVVEVQRLVCEGT